MKKLLLLFILMKIFVSFAQNSTMEMFPSNPLNKRTTPIYYCVSNLSNFRTIHCNAFGDSSSAKEEGLINYFYKNKLYVSIYYKEKLPKYEIMYKNSKIRSIFFVNRIDTVKLSSGNLPTTLFYTIYDSAYFYNKKGEIDFIYYFEKGVVIKKCKYKKGNLQCSPFELKDEYPIYMWYQLINKIKED